MVYGLGRLSEGLEEPRANLGCDARSRVADHEHRVPLFSMQHDVDLPSPGGELDRVREQVAEHLDDSGRIGIDPVALEPELAAQLYAVCLELR